MDKHAKKLAALKQGPGVFVFNGSFVTHCEPTILRTGEGVPLLDGEGKPMLRDGVMVMENPGKPVLDPHGNTQLGGPAIKKVVAVESRIVWGVQFDKGAAVEVDDPALALKLRCLGPDFSEFEPTTRIEDVLPPPALDPSVNPPMPPEPAPAPKKKPGRPKKSKA